MPERWRDDGTRVRGLLTYETMALAANPGLAIAVFTAEPGSKSEEALNLLASWTATHEQPESAFTRSHG